jgi:hypothetical protein
MKGEGVLADLIRMRFDNTVRRLGLNRERPGPAYGPVSQAVPPAHQADLAEQLTLI